MDQFDEELATTVVTESGLNRAIQEKLKPVKLVTTLNASGDVLKVTVAGADEAIKTESSDTESEDEKSA